MEKPSRETGGEGGDSHSLLWGSRIIGGIIVFLTVGAVVYSLLRKPSSEPTLASEDLATELEEETIQTKPADTVSTQINRTVEAEGEQKSPVEEIRQTPAEVRDSYSPNTTIEALMDPANRSKVYDFEISAKFETFPVSMLKFEGELVCSGLPETGRFVLEAFNNNEANYASQPLLSFLLDPLEMEEDRPFAFGNKKSFFVGVDTTIELEKGLYYYQIRLNEDPNPLFIKRFTN